MMAKNPYRKGGACYLAWEAGYAAALDAVERLLKGVDSNEERKDEDHTGAVQEGADHAGRREGEGSGRPAGDQ